MAIKEDPEHFAQADALQLSEMVKQSPLIEFDCNQYTGPTADCAWSLDRKHFFTIEQFIDEMKEQDTLSTPPGLPWLVGWTQVVLCTTE